MKAHKFVALAVALLVAVLASAQDKKPLSMLQKDRTLASYWMPAGNANHIATIAVRAEVINSTKGYVVVGYEFEGWDNFVDQQQKKDSVS